MSDAPPTTRTAYFWKAMDVPLYAEQWSPIHGALNTERLLIGLLPIREVEGDSIFFRGKEYPFEEVRVHAWIDTISDGICLEVKATPPAKTQRFFVNRATLKERFQGNFTDSSSFTMCLEPTARAVWLNAARVYIPSNAVLFCRRVPVEELYGYQITIWGLKSQDFPGKADLLRRASDPGALQVKIFGRFRAI